MSQKLLLQQLLGKCQSIREEAEINIERAAESFKKSSRRCVGEIYLSDAYANIQDLEKAMDELAASAIDFEVLFEHFYDQAIHYDENE